MAKISLADFSSLQYDASATNNLNNNNAAIETAMENTLSRDGTSPNNMNAVLDMNSNRIINLPAPGGVNDPVRLQDVTGSPTIALSITLAGDVTSPTGNGILTTTIANNAVTNAKMADNSVDTAELVNGSVTAAKLATIADDTILSNVSGGAATPSANTLTQVLDATAGNTQGSILYRNSSTWVPLLPGTSGQVLSTNGASANPSWITAAGGGGSFLTPEQYGAVGNGVTDDTAALQLFLNACQNNTGIFTPGKTYMYGNGSAVGLYVRSNSYLIGYGATLKALVTAGLNRAGINITDNTQGTAAGPDNVTIVGLTLNGNATARRAGGAFSGVGNPGGFYAISANHLSMRDCIAYDNEGDSFYIGGNNTLGGVSNYFSFDNCYASGSSRNGFSVVGAQYGGFTNCQAAAISYGASVGNFSCGWDFEPDGTNSSNDGVFAQGCTAISCDEGFGAHGANAWQINVNWINCYARGCRIGFGSGNPASNVRIIGARYVANTTNFSNTAEAIASFP